MDLTRPNPGAKAHKRLLYGLLGAVIGLVSFLILYGSVPLDVTNDSWIFYWYDEPDIVERYSGWVNLRASDWSFPLAYTDNTAYPDGVIVSFMDSMPWVCVFFKLLSPLLPQTFQFEGIYLLLAFILQGMAACLLLSRKTDSWIFLAGGTALFTFSPILLERGFRHTSLASHYLILLAILLWLTFRDKLKEQKRGFLICLVLFSLLSFLSVGITPYFIPMVLCFALLSVVDYCRLSSDAAGWKALKGAGFLTSSCAAVLAGGWLLGTLGSGVSPSRTGYGEFSLNLNGLFNPSSTGGYTWSRIIPEQPQSFYQFDGFNYLGAGLLLLLAVVLCVSTVTLRKNGRKFLIVLWENLWVVLACLCLTMFAVSNLITFGDQLLLEIPLSPELLSLCNIFRGSSRLFWPVYYLLMLGGSTGAQDWAAGRACSC